MYNLFDPSFRVMKSGNCMVMSLMLISSIPAAFTLGFWIVKKNEDALCI